MTATGELRQFHRKRCNMLFARYRIRPSPDNVSKSPWCGGGMNGKIALVFGYTGKHLGFAPGGGEIHLRRGQSRKSVLGFRKYERPKLMRAIQEFCDQLGKA